MVIVQQVLIRQICARKLPEVTISRNETIEKARETGNAFLPKFDSNGLVTAVVQSAKTLEVLMVAHMNSEAIDRTLETGIAHFWSRSRAALWMKGETSGNTLSVQELRIDCDQDALILIVEPAGPACHTGARSCFYRTVDGVGLAPVKD